LLALPIFAIGFVLHGYLFYGFSAIARKAAKDKQFRSTITFALSYLLVPIVYCVYSLIWVFAVNMPAWSLVPFLVGIFATALWSYDYAILAKKTYKACVFTMKRMKHTPAISTLLQQRTEILELFRKIG
jgi:hypothetical protein